MPEDTILVIEDDRDLSQLLSLALAMEQFMPVVAGDGASGLSEARRLFPSLILLDLMLPMMDGWEVCRHLRADEKTREIPIIIVSARKEVEDLVMGLNLGADDYVAKPFSTRELVARIRAVLRRKTQQSPDTAHRLSVGDLVIDPAQHVVTVRSTPVHLTLTEFTILYHLAQEPGRVFTRDQILTALWGDDAFVQDHNLDAHIHTIRKKIEDDSHEPRYIQTIRGAGYKLRAPKGLRG